MMEWPYLDVIFRSLVAQVALEDWPFQVLCGDGIFEEWEARLLNSFLPPPPPRKTIARKGTDCELTKEEASHHRKSLPF